MGANFYPNPEVDNFVSLMVKKTKYTRDPNKDLDLSQRSAVANLFWFCGKNPFRIFRDDGKLFKGGCRQ